MPPLKKYLHFNLFNWITKVCAMQKTVIVHTCCLIQVIKMKEREIVHILYYLLLQCRTANTMHQAVSKQRNKLWQLALAQVHLPWKHRLAFA
jgi:hypothetical protein